MITVQQFQTLKKSNVGVNAEKVKARVSATFKSATTEQRGEILKLSGFSSPNNFYSTEKSGTVSPKAVLSLAQVLGVSPYFLTGESDDKEPCNDEILSEFFKKCNQGKKKDPKAKSNKAVKTKKPIEKKTVEKPAKATSTDEKSISINKTPAPQKPKTEKVVIPVKPTSKAKNIKIDDNSLVKLLEALAIRAKFGGEAEQTYNQIIELLVK